MYQKVKSPVEVVVGTLKMTGDLQGPGPRACWPWGRSLPTWARACTTRQVLRDGTPAESGLTAARL